MLDSVNETKTMLTTTYDTVTATAKSAAEDANKSAFITTSPTTNASPVKAKTLFSWFRSGNAKSPSKTDANAIAAKGEQTHKDCRVKGEAELHAGSNAKQLPTEPQLSAAERDVTLREFRGVQSLRHLWNKRISASEDATRRQNSLGTSKASKLTKSIGCLVNATRAAAEVTQSTSGSEGEALRQKRAHSLHDCTQVGVHAEEAVATTAQVSEIDCFHREKDNFYKYKTAEQAAKHLARDSRVRTKMTRRVTAGIVGSEARDEDAHFPAVKTSERGERIHWLKRQDMVSRRRENTEMAVALTPAGREKNTATALTLSADDIVISEPANNAMPTISAITTSSTNSAQRRNCPADSADNDALAASYSPRHSVSRKRNTQRETSNASLAKRSSTDSNKSNSQSLSASGSVTSGANTGGRSARRTASSSSSSSAPARKYSFKTHTRTYHAPRKMSQRDSGAVGSGGSGSGSASVIMPGGGNIVAKLTQQFNEMIQKDKKLLEEVKRKNGVLLSRGGHVYKVVENPIAAAMEGGSKRSTLSRNTARGQDVATLRASTVQRNIIKFEGGPELDKPAVPAKSAQVLQKLRELNKAQQHSNAGSKRLLLKLPTSAPPNEPQLKIELKKAQLALPLSPPLEVVTEESKTPLEAYEKSMTISQMRGGQTDTEPTVDGTNAKIAENTYGSCDNGRVSYNGEAGDKKAINEIDQKNEDDQQQGSSVACGSANEALSSGTAPSLTVSNASSANSETKDVDEQAAASAETNDTESNAICIATTPTEVIAIKNEATKTIVEANASAEFSIPTTMTTLETTESGGRTKKTDANATSAIATPTKSTKEAALNGNTNTTTTITNPIGIDSNDDQLDAANEEKAKQRKHKYAKIYEKFRFRSPFVGGHSNKKLSSKQAASVAEVNNEFKRPETELAEDAVKTIEILKPPPTSTSSITPTSTTPTLATTTTTISKEIDKTAEGECILDADTIAEPVPEPESRLLDALDIVAHKLKDLAVDTDDENTAALLLSPDDDFEQRVLPNNSFVFQASTKQVANNKLIVAQAVNVTLVNSIEGEQLMMEQKELLRQQCDYSELVRPLSLKLEQPVTVALEEDKQVVESAPVEPMYEPIAAQNDSTKTEGYFSATELSPTKSFLYSSCAAVTEKLFVDTDMALVEDAKSLVSSVENSDIFEDIYQTVDEAKAAAQLKLAEATNAALLADYESIAGSCEHTTPATTGVSTTHAAKPLYDGYEICEPPPHTPHTLPNTMPTITDGAGISAIPKLTQQTSVGGSNVRNTNDELPELPKPKRRLPKSPMPGKRSPKSAAKTSASIREIVRTPSSRGCSKSSSNSTITALDDPDDDHHYYADDENIYDTIKGSHCYESLHAASIASQKSASAVTKCGSDNISLTSNCYESISHYRRASHSNGGGSHLTGSSSGSTLTISSDHKTNSLYEMSVTASLIYGTGSVGSRQSVAEKINASISGRIGGANNNASDESSDGPPAGAKSRCQSHGGATSDNSDEWVDISDPEAEGADQLVKQQFIVVRERSKAHRSPDWSKRVRDKRLHQKKAISCIEDDSDHYYETLSPLGNKRHSTLPAQGSNNQLRFSQNLPYLTTKNGSQRSKQYSASMHGLGALATSDDYDSFDTDTDDIYEAEESTKNNDSGVDIRNVKLPDPPPATNQVYAIVRKLKNFISSKKSPGAHSKYGDSQQKLYENSTQFYVSGNIYENTPKTKSKQQKDVKKTITPSQNQDLYENTEFHSPPAIAAEGKQLSASEKHLNSPTDVRPDASNTSTTLRSKSKSVKSFKSRLRKSLVGSTFDMKNLSTLAPTRSTFYIEDPTYGGSGELDSGFSEKASSGDLPTAPGVPTPESQKFSTVARKAKKEAKASTSQRRRTTIGIRPQDPPPPPPVASSTTSWYAECGVFKNGTSGMLQESEISLNDSKASQSGSSVFNGNSWYTEAGLYQTSGVSVASSSGSSGVSTGNEGTLGDDLPHSMFQNEPLYQIYSAAKLESITRDMERHDSSTDGYEEIGQNGSTSDARASIQKHQRPSAFQLIEPKNGPSRTLWSEIPEVISSCVLATLTPRERSLQEAKFEIITSEASYLKSLNLLRSHFMNHPIFRDTNVVSARDRKALFAYIVPVHECSEKLLTEMESCWQDNIMLIGLSKRIFTVAEKYFHVYISFCEHQGRMDRTLRRLKESRGIFAQNLHLLETSPTCCGLNLHSFLMLPMQRITRLPLLIDAVFSKVSPNDDEYENWKMTLAIMNKIVTQCNEAANRCEQAYEIERIARQLEFPSTIRALAISPMGIPAPGSKPRFLVKRGELTHFLWRGDDVKLTFGKRFSKVAIYAFLFSDLLVLTKRKGEEQFTVFDYCPRNMLTISSGDLRDISQTHKNLILMTLLENHERKTVELVLSCPSVSEQERWLQAVRPPEPETPGEKLYAPWDCPQVITKHAYETREPDALSLEVGDVVNVTRKLPDGWYQGERIRDGVIGWFPGSYTEEVNSAHVRARNLKQRQRLLTFTATYLESQKRK